tara:strand:+ start:1396 stop:2379 length:984 start_codon:yes stop_codon:yes gene_type:complete
MIEIAVIGAGLTGITISSLLKKKVKLCIFEKSRGVGGRIATRRAEPYQFNHGAQYFKIENKEFKDFLNPLIRNNIIKPWKANHIEIENKLVIKRIKINNNKYFAGFPAMNSIVKYLATNDFFIKLSCKIVKIEQALNKWYIIDSDSACYGPYDWIIFTIPPNQVSEILCKKFKYLDIIKTIKMKSCFSLMLGYNEIKKFNFDTALFLDEDIQWLSNNRKYFKDREYNNLLINSSYNFAKKNINSCKEKISDYLLNKASDILNYKFNNYDHMALHFWKYATSENRNDYGSFIDANSKIIVCGDWCMNGKVEGAFLSAKNAVNKFLNHI